MEVQVFIDHSVLRALIVVFVLAVCRADAAVLRVAVRASLGRRVGRIAFVRHRNVPVDF